MIERWSRGDSDRHMDQAILVDLAPIIERHPWWQARARLTLALLRKLGVPAGSRVLDAGCGWGVTLRTLEKEGFHAVGLDVSPRALERLDAEGRHLIEADLTRPFPPGAERFAAVLALDVIEHLDDDRAAVAHLASLVEPGGFLVISVPAHPDLYSEFDAIQGHRRRYLPESLRAAFSDSGLTPDPPLWWGAWLVPPLRRGRKRRRGQPGDTPEEVYRRYLKLPPWPIPHLLRAAFWWEQPAALRGVLKTGTSLFAVARKPR